MHKFFLENYKICPRCGATFKITGDHLHCEVCGFNIYGNPAPATAIAIWKDNQILLAKRKFEPYKDWWDLVGGFVNPDESLEECCLREVKEETNLDVSLTKYLGSKQDSYDNMPTLNFFYQAKIISGTEKPQDDVALLQWFDKDNLPEKIAFNYPEFALKK